MPGPGGGVGARGSCSRAAAQTQCQEGRWGFREEGHGQTQPPSPGSRGSPPRVDEPPLRRGRGFRRGRAAVAGTSGGARTLSAGVSAPRSFGLRVCKLARPESRCGSALGFGVRAPDRTPPCGGRGSSLCPPPPAGHQRTLPALHSVSARPGVAGVPLAPTAGLGSADPGARAASPSPGARRRGDPTREPQPGTAASARTARTAHPEAGRKVAGRAGTRASIGRRWPAPPRPARQVASPRLAIGPRPRGSPGIGPGGGPASPSLAAGATAPARDRPPRRLAAGWSPCSDPPPRGPLAGVRAPPAARRPVPRARPPPPARRPSSAESPRPTPRGPRRAPFRVPRRPHLAPGCGGPAMARAPGARR